MLQIDWTTQEPNPSSDQILVIPVAKGFSSEEIGKRFGMGLRRALERSPFKAARGETFGFTKEAGDELVQVALYGVGEGLTGADEIRRFGHDAARHAASQGVRHLVVDLRWNQAGALGFVDDLAHLGSLLAQGLELGTYAYERFLSEPKPRALERVTMWSSDTAAHEGTARGQIIASSISLARDLANGPAALVTPTFLAQTAQEMVERLRKEGVDVELTVLEREECQKRGMGCYLGVAQGSDEPPKFIHLRYKPAAGARGRVALVGKGITFDSGGYSIKPSDGMMDMKMDMAGAAAVLASFEGLARMGVGYEVHVIVAAAENMISGRAYRLGDVLVASNGKTVEINNTDAEGRLTLADALVYAGKLEPDVTIDFATLTGACVVALGPHMAGMMSRDERLVADWTRAATRSGEGMWRLPLPDELKEQLKSKVADMRNTGERWGGAITAGLFLSEFTQGQRWLHVDIAGPAIAGKPWGVNQVGGTGFAVATVLELLQREVAVGE